MLDLSPGWCFILGCLELMEIVPCSLLAAALCLGTGYSLLVFEAIRRMKTFVTA